MSSREGPPENQVRGLHYGFERIAEIVRQRAEFFRHLRRDLTGSISHDLNKAWSWSRLDARSSFDSHTQASR